MLLSCSHTKVTSAVKTTFNPKVLKFQFDLLFAALTQISFFTERDMKAQGYDTWNVPLIKHLVTMR
ncbi:MAG TPA: hypothetical protein DG084_05830 [Gemmatimonadetes bacterium]|nr:hypothetical protein [Gemmatimonadota bacterium]